MSHCFSCIHLHSFIVLAYGKEMILFLSFTLRVNEGTNLRDKCEDGFGLKRENTRVCIVHEGVFTNMPYIFRCVLCVDRKELGATYNGDEAHLTNEGVKKGYQDDHQFKLDDSGKDLRRWHRQGLEESELPKCESGRGKRL